MNWCFYEDIDFSDCYNELYNIGINHINYYPYKTTNKTVESNPNYSTNVLTDMYIFTEKDGVLDIPIVKKIIERLPFRPNTASFIKLFPNVVMPIHIDDPKLRASHLIFPIYPLDLNFTTTKFYNKKNEIIDEAKFNIDPVLINTQCRHGLINNLFTRIQFNLGFSENIYDW